MKEEKEILPPFEADGLRLNTGGGSGVQWRQAHFKATIGAYT